VGLQSAVKFPQQSLGHSPRKVGFGVFLGFRKSPIFVHNTPSTCYSSAINGRDSFWPGWPQIAAGETQATAGGAEPPAHSHPSL